MNMKLIDELSDIADKVADLEQGFEELHYERAEEYGDPNRHKMAAAQDDPIPTPLADRIRMITKKFDNDDE